MIKLNKSIVNKEKRGLYIFVGTEVIVRDIYVNKILEIYGLDYTIADDVKGILPSMKNKLLLNKNKAYIIRDDKEFYTDENMWELLEDSIGDNCVILIYLTLDKRGKFYKRYSNKIVWFAPLEENILLNEIKNKVDLLDIYCLDLIKNCNNDYGKILLEIDKIQTYSKIKNLPLNLTYNQLLELGGIVLPPNELNFSIIEILLSGDLKSFIEIMSDIPDTNAIGVLSMLYVGIRNAFLVKSCRNRDISGETGLNYYFVKKIQEYNTYFSPQSLSTKMELIIETINGIKNGTINSKLALPYCLVKLIKE